MTAAAFLEDPFDLWRALTVTQPWGGLLATGIKPIENRSRKIAPRGQFGKRFAIHASRVIDESVYARIIDIDGEAYRATYLDRSDGMLVAAIDTTCPWYKLSRVTSAIIAVATLEHDEIVGQLNIKTGKTDLMMNEDRRRVGDYAARWFFGPIGYVLSNVVALPEPVPCRGFQGFWTMTPATRAAVLAQLEAKAA